MNHPKYITDLGESFPITPPIGTMDRLPRYGVWQWSRAKGAYQCIDSSNNLNHLREKHSVDTQIVRIGEHK